MQIIAPNILNQAGMDWRKRVDQVASQRHFRPFQDTTIQFLESLSKHILLDRSMRMYPELMAMAHWIRKGHILELQKQYEQQTNKRYFLARGTVIHFAPANVDSIFIYSWILSMLAGNKNIIRLSRRTNDQTEILMSKINDILMQTPFQEIADKTLLVRYGYEEEYTSYLSQVCDMRVLWGGDQSVLTIRAIPLSPNAVELVFPNRYSKALLSAEAIIQANEQEMKELAKKFYNDSLWYSQLACSSPREIFWLGEKEQITIAKERFWDFTCQRIEKEQYRNEPALNLLRLTTSNYYAAQNNTGNIEMGHGSQPVRVEIMQENEQLREVHCGGGLFLEYSLVALEQLLDYIQDRDQTLSYFGITRHELIEWATLISNRGIDRIVPVGDALNFDPVWDGYDLLTYFSRELIIK